MTSPAQKQGVFIIGRDGTCEYIDGDPGVLEPDDVLVYVSFDLPDTGCTSEQMAELRRRFEPLPDEAGKTAEESSVPKRARSVVKAVKELCEEALDVMDRDTRFWKLQFLTARARAVTSELDFNHRLYEPVQRSLHKLTYLASKADVGFIKGLRVNAVEDWVALERKAERTLANLATRRPAVRNDVAPRPKPLEIRLAEDDEDYEPEPETLDAPKLRSLIAEGKSVLLVGGMPKHDKIARMTEWLGASPDWPDVIMDRGAVRQIDGLEQRIRRGGYACVLMLNGIMSHSSSGKLTSACKQSGTPYRLVHKGGLLMLRTALKDIEAHIV